MPPLVIEYLLEGHTRGYNFTSPTNGYRDETLKHIWRNAMPRGQGWGVDVYRGARSLKSFWLDDGRVAVSEVTVTDMRDESGRGGIRRAVIDVLRPADWHDYLRDRQRALPSTAVAPIARKPNLRQNQQIVNRTLPRCRGECQIVLSYPYRQPDDWQTIEALVLKIVLSPALALKRQGGVVPFTTLALDHHGESLLVLLPEEKARQVTRTPVIALG
jgi:hypothetical protein